MNFLSVFLHQEVPKSAREMPEYYRKALFLSEASLAAYFLVSLVLLDLTIGRWEWIPAIVLSADLVCLFNLDRMTAKLNLAAFSAIICAWLAWYVFSFGWTSGVPNILVPILPLAFFNIFVTPVGKIASFLGLVVFRVGLFAFTLYHRPTGALDSYTTLILQIINSVVPFLILAVDYILFSSSIQASERQLTINNQELHKEAGTDPLTGLPNRRALLDVIDQFRQNSPSSAFSLAIADIDFFKKVNDSYGHNCGDYTLKELSGLFVSFGQGKYSVGRWGGEEFCFFIPELNLDQAGMVMNGLNSAVKKMPLRFNGVDFSISITIGVEEFDFQSSVEALIDRADRKLYMGKVHGRDQVVL